MLNLEAVFTVLLARPIYKEQIGRRVALTLMALGGAALTFDAASAASWSLLGAVAIISATVAWALDNALSRALAEQDVGRDSPVTRAATLVTAAPSAPLLATT